MDKTELLLTLNGGSSSLKFALFDRRDPARRQLHGQFDRLGLVGSTFHVRRGGNREETRMLNRMDHGTAARFLFDWLEDGMGLAVIGAVAHRVVHGGPCYREPRRVDKAMLEELERISGFAPEHLPAAIQTMRLCGDQLPGIAQIACFDTAFHRDMPEIAKILPIPRCYRDAGIERYGFHGLSYGFLMTQLPENEARGRVVLAHLGNGASLAAVRDGKSIDTTMGFTPVAGIPMSSRSGDLDPGLVHYLARSEGMDAAGFDRMVNHQSGLLGMSGTSSDIRDLLDREESDPHAAEAVDHFCYAIKKSIGALAAALGGIDTLVFSGGIGENAAPIRARVCAGLRFLGIEIDPERNDDNALLISKSDGTVAVRIIKTNEEAMMAQAAAAILDAPRKEGLS